MTARGRLMLFLPGAGGLLFLLLHALHGLPGFGYYPGPYGDVLNRIGVTQRHATNLVTAVNFDYRAFDTVGEEFILFAATTGVVLLLRQLRGEREGPPPARDERMRGASEALRALALGSVLVTIVIGAYIVAHGAITPGGGFQGGVLLACGAFLAFVAGETIAMKRVAPERFLEFAEAAGAAGFVLIGIGGALFAGAFFENFLELGKPGSLNSAGTMPFVSIAIGIEVAGAFLLVWTEFVDQTLIVRTRDRER